MKSSHWTNAPLPLLEAVRKASGKSPNSQAAIYRYLNERGIQFSSVVDFGCGHGAWLKAATDTGINDVRGYDIPEIDVSERHFNPDNFFPQDLTQLLTVDREFDLVVSAEVAEHISPSGLHNFIANLCNFGDMVLFTAAPPYQGGMSHCNENWMEYWANLFFEQGFKAFDFVRSDLWNNAEIAYYYRQNIMVFATGEKAVMLESLGLVADHCPKSLIHPELYLKAVNRSLPGDMNRLSEDIHIYYSHLRSLELGEAPKQFNYGYGAEQLSFEAIKKRRF